MIKILTSMSAIAIVSTLSACGTSEPADKQASMNTAEFNSMLNHVTDDSADQFSNVMHKMNEAMMTAVGTDAGDNWVRKMIGHHRGAIEMSRIVLAQSPTVEVAKMARSTIEKQGKEISELEKLIATGTPDPTYAGLYLSAATDMHNAMTAAKGANISETYLSKMLAHHKGAVAMSDIALANGATGAVRTQIEKTRADRQMEVDMVEAMLRREPMMTMAPAPTAKPAASKPVAPGTSAKAKPAQAEADPHAGMDMNNM